MVDLKEKSREEIFGEKRTVKASETVQFIQSLQILQKEISTHRLRVLTIRDMIAL